VLVLPAQQDQLLNLLDPLNAPNVEQGLTKLTEPLVQTAQLDGFQSLLRHLNVLSAKRAVLKLAEPLVPIVPQGPLLELVHQGRPHVKHAQQDQLQANLGRLSVHNAKQELTKLIEHLAVLVPQVLSLWLEPRAKKNVPSVLQDLSQAFLDLLNAQSVKEDTMK